MAKINVETAMAQSQMRDTVLDVESGPPAVLLASASADGLVRLWDLRSLVCVVQFQAHSECVFLLTLNVLYPRLITRT